MFKRDRLLAEERALGDASWRALRLSAEVVRLGGGAAVVPEHKVVGCLKKHRGNWY